MAGMRNQPQERARINRGASLSKDLVFAAIPASQIALPGGIAASAGAGPVVPASAGLGYTITTGAHVQVYPVGDECNFNGTDFTVAVLVDLLDNTSGYRGLIGKRNSTSGNGIWSMGFYPGGQLVFSGSGVDRQLGATGFSNRQKALLAVTGSRSKGLLTGYQDGMALRTGALPSYLAGNSAPIRLGTFRGDSLNENVRGNYILALVWRRELSPDELRSLYANPWQVFEGRSEDEEEIIAALMSRSPANNPPLLPQAAASVQGAVSAGGAISQAHSVRGAASSQPSTSSSGAIAQVQILGGAPSSQANGSAPGVIGELHIALGAPSFQANGSGSGAIMQSHTLAGAPSSQASNSVGAAITQEHRATGAASMQPNASPGAEVESAMAGRPTGASSGQSNASSTGALAQTHMPVGAASAQANASSSAAVGQIQALVGAPSSQRNTSGTGNIAERHIAVGAPSFQSASCTVGAITQWHRPLGAESAQGNASPSAAAMQEIGGIPREVVSITVTPATISLGGDGVARLSVQVVTAGGASSEVALRAELGTITQDGAYTAPHAVGIERKDTITITPIADKSKAVSVEVFISAGLFDAYGLPIDEQPPLEVVIWPELVEPTESQKVAGNYRKDRMRVAGLPIVIENPRGSTRKWRAQDGSSGAQYMTFAYGYIAGTLGNDGDELDCTIGPSPRRFEAAYVVNQFLGGEFDEHKIMLGFSSQAEAEAAYLGSYEYGWQGMESCIPCSLLQLKWWIDNGNKARPLTEDQLSNEGPTMEKVLWDSSNRPLHSNLEQVLYALRSHDGDDGLLFDSVSIADILGDADGVLAMDALVVPFARLEQRMQLLQKVLDRTSKGVKVAAMQVSDPFTQRGSTNVAVIYELTDGQTISVFFHNPDVTPKKIAAGDDVISWKWMLNKKDITVAVAPERGRDLDVRTVAARIMLLAEKNSARFASANVKRAERMETITGLKAELEAKEATLAGLEQQIATITAEREVAGLEDPVDPLPPMPDPQPAPAPAALKVDGIKAVVTDADPMPGVARGADWIVMNASRPLMGTETMSNGEFLDGRFYAAIDPADGMAQAYVDENVKNGASVVFSASKPALLAMVLQSIDAEYIPAYMGMDEAERAGALAPRIAGLNGKTYGELKALAAKGMPVLPAQLPEPQGETYRDHLIYPTRIKLGEEVKFMFAVQSAENKALVAVGERAIGGDTLHSTIEQARAEVDRMIAKAESDAKSKAEYDAREAERLAKETAARAEFEDVDGFTDGMTPMQKEKALQALNTVVNYRGSSTTRKAIIRQKVADGFYIEDDEADGRILTDGDVFQGVKQITKTGLDYAAFLIAKRPAPAVNLEAEAAAKKAADDEESADGDFLALAADGKVDFYDKAVTDRLAALAKKYTDPEGSYVHLISQAKTAAKLFFIAEFKKKVG